MTLAKSNIKGAITPKIGSTRKKSRHIIEALLKFPKLSLGDAEDVMISRFGKFSVTEQRQPGLMVQF